jgi:adenylyltransferase and sulfurtransferase
MAANELPFRPISRAGLTPHQAQRYARQSTLGGNNQTGDIIQRSSFGPHAQKRLLGSSCIVIGCGGLGCPAAMYLASAGCAKVALVDGDTVEISNLHRQIAHTEMGAKMGTNKAVSLAESIARLNEEVITVVIESFLTRDNAIEVLRDYDVVLDCTDNVSTRYMLNDACVLLNKPLVSAAAVRTEGQLTVYHGLLVPQSSQDKDQQSRDREAQESEYGPCLRCVFPEPPPPESVGACATVGVLGPVPGVMGTLQALEAIKVLTGVGTPLVGQLLFFEGLTGAVRRAKLRGRRVDCAVCGDTPSVSTLSELDYDEFCGGAAADSEGPKQSTQTPEVDTRVNDSSFHVSCSSLVETVASLGDRGFLLVDVRPRAEFDMFCLSGAVNFPLATLERSLGDLRSAVEEKSPASSPECPVFLICRRGQDSQEALEILRRAGMNGARNVVGGLAAWHREVDASFPVY